MRFIALILLMSIWLPSISLAQSYEPLKSRGHLPDDFTLAPSTKYENLVNGISSMARKSGRAIEEQFYLKSSFIIDELLKSGKVLFNDPLTTYVNEVADSLLISKPALRKELRFYAVRSASANAFATHEGIIFVNLGLLARLENEAQLAFVLAHEIIHYEESHALNLFANATSHQHSGEKGLLREQSLEKELLSKQQFSRDLEMDADRRGFALFSTSNYSSANLTSLFDMLAINNRPIENLTFQGSFFETDYLKFPNRLFLNVNNPADAAALKVRNSTHPDITIRKKVIEDISLENPHYKKTFLVASTLFYKLREKARYELSYLYLNDNNYYSAIYNSYVLLKQGEKSIYLEKCIAKALQGFVYFRNAKRTNKVEIHHDYVRGEIQELHYFLNKLKNDELNVMALSYVWELYEKYPNDEELKDITLGLFQQMVNYHYDKLDAFYRKAPSFETSMAAAEMDNNVLKNGWDKDFIRYAFVKYLKDPEFLNFFRSSKKQKHIQLQKAEFAKSKHGKSILKNRNRKIEEEGQALGINKIVIVNPHYIKFDKTRRKGKQKLFIESETARQNFRKKIWKNARMLDLQTSILDIKNLKTTDSKKYNDISVLNEWFDQQLDFDEFNMPSFNQDRVDEIAKKYNTKYFVWMGVVNKKERRNLLNSLSEFYMPYNGLYNLLTPAYESLFFAIVYDVKNYELKMVKMEFIKQKDHDSIINAHIYDTFLQVKKEK
jgi:Zn-dependent protease with chaperone function